MMTSTRRVCRLLALATATVTGLGLTAAAAGIALAWARVTAAIDTDDGHRHG